MVTQHLEKQNASRDGIDIKPYSNDKASAQIELRPSIELAG
jgi:hypothetical protein